jgi:hypothetical protein
MSEGSDVGNLCILQRSCSFSAGCTFPVFLVSRGIEPNEQEEVGAKYAHPGEGSEFLTSTAARGG